MRGITAGMLVATVRVGPVTAQQQGAARQHGATQQQDGTQQQGATQEDGAAQQNPAHRGLEPGRDSLAAKANALPTVIADEGGFGSRSADGDFQLRLGGYVQTDGRFFVGDAASQLTNTFLVRRIRAIVEAAVYRSFEFRLMPDWGGGTAALQDAWVAARVQPELRIVAGKFKAPVSLERLQSATDLLFVERAFPTNLAPNRDVGIAIGGDVGRGLLRYDVAVLNGAVDGGSADVDPEDARDVAVRLLATPFRGAAVGALRGLSIGIAGTIGAEHGTPAAPGLATYRSPGQRAIFAYRTDGSVAGTTVAAGRRWRVAPQAYYHWGRLGVLAEWIRSSQEVRRDTATAAVPVTAWQVAASFTLTGEDASLRGIVPRRPVGPAGPARHGLGAVELVARHSAFDVGANAFPHFADATRAVRRAREWAVGFNWYLARGIKVTVDGSRTTYGGGAASGNRETEHALLSRMQLAF